MLFFILISTHVAIKIFFSARIGRAWECAQDSYCCAASATAGLRYHYCHVPNGGGEGEMGPYRQKKTKMSSFYTVLNTVYLAFHLSPEKHYSKMKNSIHVSYSVVQLLGLQTDTCQLDERPKE